MVRRGGERLRQEEGLEDDLLHESRDHPRGSELPRHHQPRFHGGGTVGEVRRETVCQGHLRPRRPFLRIRTFEGNDSLCEGGHRKEAHSTVMGWRDASEELRSVHGCRRVQERDVRQPREGRGRPHGGTGARLRHRRGMCQIHHLILQGTEGRRRRDPQ